MLIMQVSTEILVNYLEKHLNLLLKNRGTFNDSTNIDQKVKKIF